ncbi:hypothetical protein CDV36_011174 [Fusarium kuroshium]|uniref:Uncharacterized protein n=1 Tax=Fusarium kuroshium TaxID=2010991 RepID=A0A3M2RV84_9HYPO|nr:hypothetical protein CDV36_011174 [Fusarium kuroshium]
MYSFQLHLPHPNISREPDQQHIIILTNRDYSLINEIPSHLHSTNMPSSQTKCAKAGCEAWAVSGSQCCSAHK